MEIKWHQWVILIIGAILFLPVTWWIQYRLRKKHKSDGHLQHVLFRNMIERNAPREMEKIK